MISNHVQCKQMMQVKSFSSHQTSEWKQNQITVKFDRNMVAGMVFVVLETADVL